MHVIKGNGDTSVLVDETGILGFVSKVFLAGKRNQFLILINLWGGQRMDG